MVNAANNVTISDNDSQGINSQLNNDNIFLNPDNYTGENNTSITIGSIKNITISGNAPTKNVIINAENLTKIFTVDTGSKLTFINITIAGGKTAIINYGNIDIINCIFINNDARIGGAISNGGTMTITNSNFTNNTANLFGASIFNIGNLSIIKSNFN